MALVVKNVAYGEADSIVTLFTERLGKISAIARGARRGRTKLGGVLDALHTLRVVLDERPTSELLVLSEASIEHPRVHVLAKLERIEASGVALRWVRAGSPVRTAEPAVWIEITGLLERLDDPTDETPPGAHLAATGLRLLRAFGYGLELGSCARCGRPCDPSRSAYVDAAVGGIVCRSCGGGGRLLDGPLRGRLDAAASGKDDALTGDDVRVARELVEVALAAHAGVS